MRIVRRTAALAALLALALAHPASGQDAADPAADGRAPSCPEPEARGYDFWIGEWDVENRNRNPQNPDAGLFPTGSATNRVHAILDGCAIVEHWEGALVWDHVLGFSVRAYDPERGTWVAVLNWPSPQGPGFSLLEGIFEDGAGNLRAERETPNGTVRLWFRFADIEDDAFRWIGSRAPGDEPWREFWTMEFRRRDPVTDGGLVNGPTRRIADRCAGERHRDYDFAIGDWAGEETVTGADGEETTRPVAVRVWSIMEGCALVVFEGEDDGEPDDAFAVASYVPGDERWVAYSIERGGPVFRRWDGPADPAGPEPLESGSRVGESDPDAPLLKTAWTPLSADRWGREVSASTDGGETWRTIATVELERR